MKRRTFLALGGAGLVASKAPLAQPAAPPLLELQRSPLAGFQFYEGERLWHRLQVDQPLRLIREPRNEHDQKAVAVWWHDARLGYVPRNENHAVSQLLDRKERLSAAIGRLRRSRNPWDRIELVIYLERA